MKKDLKIVYKPAGDLKPWDQNPKHHNMEAIKRSIERYGPRQPIMVQKGTLRIIAGHGRLQAYTELGYTQVPCMIWDCTDKEADAYAIADNQLTISAGWDEDTLSMIIQDLPLEFHDTLGFDSEELEAFLDIDTGEPELVEDSFTEDVEPTCQRGQLWQLGSHRLLCGDSTNSEDMAHLMDGARADMVFTDPPYGIDYSGGRTHVVRDKPYGKLIGDSERDITHLVEPLVDLADTLYICASSINLTPVLLPFEPQGGVDGIIVWKKPSPSLGYQYIRRYCEFIIFKSYTPKKKDAPSEFDFWDIATDNKTEYQHGTQKPVALPARAIQFTKPKTILDPFGGSGSTLIAAEQLHRTCYTMEIDPHYCDVIINRWEQLTGQKAELLGGEK